MGIIAQELAEVAPRLATKSDQGHYLVNYDGITPILIEATKDQQEIIEEQEAKIEEQAAKIEAMESEIEAIKAMLEADKN
jgi:ABC-type Fe3+-citrate transport system substrate-binding protein